MSGPPRKSRKPTATTKAHRFEGFTKRIAKIKIDPVHTVQKTRVAEDHEDLSNSFFRSSLDEWAELNLSATFTSFLNKAQPLSESLPQLLHHSDTIFSLLHDHIAKQDVLSLEPLLSLVAHLAHDLGSAFEKHFSSMVQLVAQVSAVVDDPAAIEYCFTCLAWMFKYLSRLLVQDLRPLFGIMVPYFSSKKEYVRRFSAESLAFLLRKAAVMYERKPRPLQISLGYLFDQLKGEDDHKLVPFEMALMTLLSESAMGVDAQLHSSATNLFTCTFALIGRFDANNERALAVVDGTVVSLIHQTDAAGFRPLLHIITEMAVNVRGGKTSQDQMSIRLLQVVTITRKGSRISEWKATLEALLAHLCHQESVSNQHMGLSIALLTVSAVSIQYCPMDQLLPFANKILDLVVARASATQFFGFCELVAEIGRQRFQDLLLPRLQHYIASFWNNNEEGVCYLLQQLRRRHLVSPKPGEPAYLACPNDWEQYVVACLRGLPADAGFPASTAKYFQLHEALHFPRQKVALEPLQSLLDSFLHTALSQHNAVFDPPSRLNVGWAFNFYVLLSRDVSTTNWPHLAKAILQCRPEYYQLVPFLESCLEILGLAQIDTLEDYEYQSVEAALCDNMLSESLELREKSLEILLALATARSDDWLRDTCTLLLELLRIPYMPSNARQISMLVRRLPKQQELVDHATTLHRLTPLFGLGLLRHYHDRTRKDLCAALALMASDGKAEDIIVDTATQWLQKSNDLEPSGQARADSDVLRRLSPFECSNYQAVEKMSDSTFERHSRAENELRQTFEQAHALRPATIPAESRIISLQLFLEIPELAEKRSRMLSPVFLSIQQGMSNHHHVPHSDESTSSHTVSPDASDQLWSLLERKLFLELMGKFVNPRVLYRSRELYEYLLELLTNGNSDIRRLALLALLNWKDSSLAHHRETLLRVADEKNATTELALLLANDEQTGSIEPRHRQNVLPVLLRLVFGQLVGRSGTHGSQEAKRKAILRLLFRMEEQEINVFLDITLGRLGEVSFTDATRTHRNILDHDILSRDQQYGFLRMVMSIQETLQNQYAPYGKRVLDAVLYCTVRAHHQANSVSLDDTDTTSTSALVKNIRRSGIQCLTTIFEHCEDVDWRPYLSLIFDEVISPRVPNLATELTQGVSALLRLFSAWSKSSRLVFLLKEDSKLSESLWRILSVPSARDDVRLYVLEHILTPLLELSAESDLSHNSASEVLTSDVDLLLKSFMALLEGKPPKDLLLATTKAIPLLAPFTLSSATASKVLDLLIVLICEPAQRIPPHVKSQLLSATASLLKSHQAQVASETKLRLYDVVAELFNYFKDQPSRHILCELLSVLTSNEVDMQAIVQICQDLNAVSTKSLGEIDYERRLAAYNAVDALTITDSNPHQWLPILQNLLFFSRTADDFAIRSNAVACLKRFVVEACTSQILAIQASVANVLLPAFKKGVKEKSELVRADFVAMYGMVVKHLPGASDLEDMKVLLVGDDEEASFFTNILHIQQHRRVRAIRRLLAEVERGVIRSQNIAGFFLPLLEKFIDDEGDDESAQGVKGQSIVATSTLLQWVDWKSFRTMFRQYRSDLDTSARPEKEAIKLLSNGADALTSACNPRQESMAAQITPYLQVTLPSMNVVSAELKSSFIPKLSKFIHHKDEAEISLRVPAAKVAVKLIKLLPADEIPLLVAPIILDISQILRSRAQESRDTARNTLAEIVLLLGSSSVQFILKEMRTTLTRGYQLHVLSYTLHTILLQSAEVRKPGDLDYCLEDLVSVIMDDIFGAVGQEKENQDYISGMKEVKSSKSQDSMEILAKSSSVRCMPKLLQPLQALLSGNMSTRQVRQVNELFRRIGVGISHNPAASSRDLLVFAYELIRAFYQQKAGNSERVMTNDQKNRQRYLVQLKSASESTRSTSSSLQYKVARFALDVVRSTLAKTPALLIPENVHGFLPIIGDALLEAQEDVRMSAFRLLSTIIKLPMPELDQNAALYVMEAVKVIRGSISTNDEPSQAAMKLVAAVLRERKDVQVRDSDIAYLLHRTMPDIEEPDKQGVIFNFVKAVMARRYELPEVYELMDKVAVMMVTNQTRSARDAARGVFVHFLLDYPQSKSRWSKQVRFLIKNLTYEYKEGRQSVMEATHTLLQKLKDAPLQEMVSTFFIPIVLAMVNDDDSGCREMAGALLAQMFRVTETSKVGDLLVNVRSWSGQADNKILLKVSLLAWSVYFDVITTGAEDEVPAIRKSLVRALKDEEDSDLDWEIKYQALELFSKLIASYPAMTMTQAQSTIWATIRRLLSSQHEWIQISAAHVVGTFFLDCENGGNATELPLEGKHGLRFDRVAVMDLLRGSVRVLRTNEGNLGLAQKTLQNLAFLGKYVEASEMTCEVKAQQSTNGDEAANDTIEGAGSESGDDSGSDEVATRSIPAIEYLFHQLTLILRREPSRLSTASFTPRLSALSLLSNLVAQTPLETFSTSTLTSILVPITHITDPSLQQPRSADITFAATYQSYTESAQNLQEAIQRKVGDATYVKLMTDVSKIVRERRGERRTKRAIERVAEPERAEREKKRKKDMKARRKKNVVDIHRQRRRGDLGF